MLLSTRKNPPGRLALPKTRQSFTIKQFLLHSPLPSPALPAIVPRHGKKPARLNVRKIVRSLCWLAIGATLWVAYHRAVATTESSSARLRSQRKPSPVVALRTDLPDQPSVITLNDTQGRPRWTVFFPGDMDEPLSGRQYAAIYTDAVGVSQKVAQDERAKSTTLPKRYTDSDPNYLDVTEARQQGLLPALPIRSVGDQHRQPSCKKSLTYVLDTTQAGLGEILLGLWLSYGLARREQREFFLDDSEFAYGTLGRLFTPPTIESSCQPPSWNLRTPYPRDANHLVIGPSTQARIFDMVFSEHFTIKEIYSMARAGYEALFQLRQDDANFVQARLSELQKPLAETHSSIMVGIHVRRGDRHPLEFQYQQSYLPPSKYISVARNSANAYKKSSILIASDDADLYQDPEVEGTIRAQEQIRLASKKQLGKSGLGWEGGFFTDSFWSIGLPDHERKRKYIDSPTPTKARGKWSSAATAHTIMDGVSPAQQDDSFNGRRDYKSDPTPEALQLREYIGRAYLLDLAVLAGSDEIVCGVSSSTCRVLGVMMGWDNLHKGKWKNVDGEYGWRALY